MPSFVMHIAIVKEYVKKHKDDIKNLDEFIKGTIAPDLAKNKNITHYGEWNNNITEIVFENFLEDNNNIHNTDYFKGYFLHLLADDFTYNNFLKKEYDYIKKEDAFDIAYEEFYYLNKVLIPKYEIYDLPKEIENYSQIKNGECKYLKVDKIIDMIEEISNINLEEQIDNIRKNGNPKYNLKEV